MAVELQPMFLARVKRRIENHKFYFAARQILKTLRELNVPDRKVVSLKPEGIPKGNVLLSYVIDPFLLKPGQPVSNAHTIHWESLQMARTFLDMGYCVDVISYRNDTFKPAKDYSFLISSRLNLERLAQLLNKDCVKVMHITTAHWLFHMSAQHRRLLALRERRGVSLRLRKIAEPNWAIEHADCATILGNKFTISTYSYANKSMLSIPNSTAFICPWPSEKDFESVRKHFLWFGSGGLVHKGLDLVLEAFAQMPEYHLTVCGPIDREVEFKLAYFKELYQTPNIQTVGWVDVTSPKFREISNNCIGLIYPSCSEGQSGAVVTCLHAGLIPIISYESGLDVDDFGFILKTCTIEEIKTSVQMVATISSGELQSMARKGWEFARAHHTRDRFAEEYRSAVLEIKSTYSNGKTPGEFKQLPASSDQDPVRI